MRSSKFYRRPDGWIAPWRRLPALCIAALMISVLLTAPTAGAPVGLDATPVPPPRVRVWMIAVDPPDAQVAVGGEITFSITVRNVGVIPITFLWVMDQYPPDCLAYVSAVPWGLDDQRGRVIWSHLTLPAGGLQPGASVSLMITLRVLAECTNVVNEVFVSGISALDQSIPPSYDSVAITVLPHITPTLVPTPTATPPAQTRVFQQGQEDYSGTRDTYLSAWYATRNYDRASALAVRAGGLMIPLIRFDLSALPRDAEIAQATLVLTVASGGFYEQEVSVYEVLTPWVAGEATWRLAAAGVPWQTAGANGVGVDRSGKAADTELAIASTTVEFDVTELVAKWVADPAANHGVLLRGTSGIAVQHNLASAEHWNRAVRPQLVVRYRLVAQEGGRLTVGKGVRR